MNKKQLQERIKKFVQKKIKEQDAGFAAGTGYQHTGKKPKNEQKRYQNPPKDGKGVPSVFTKGADDLSAYKSIGYREVKPSEMIDAAYLWAGKGGLKEGRYSQFKKQTEVVKPSSQMHTAIKEIKKRLQEVNKIAGYTKQLKNDLSEVNDVNYNKRTEAYLEQLMRETATLYKNLKEIKNGSKSKN
jgi:uncharacterized membrane-anchored protein YjiN (DUF445 family)